MVDEQKEVLFQKLQKEIKDLIFISKRRNVLNEIKDLLYGEVSLSLQDIILLYKAYLNDIFKDFRNLKEKLERQLSNELSYPVRLTLSLVRDEWRQDINTPENMEKCWCDREYEICCKELVSINMFFNHQEQSLLEEVYWSHEHVSYLQNKKLDYLYDVYSKYENDLEKIMHLYYNAVSSIPFFEKKYASYTAKSRLIISCIPFYRFEVKSSSGNLNLTGEWIHELYYFSEELPINLILNKEGSFQFIPWHLYGDIFISFDLDCHLHNAFLNEKFNFITNNIFNFDVNVSDEKVLSEIQFMISVAFPNFKIYLNALPDFFRDYLEKNIDTDYLIKGKKQFDKGKRKEKIKELQIVDKTKQLVADNNLKIVKLVKKNQELYEKLGERQPITKDILCKMEKDEESNYWLIRPEFRNDLEYYDLSNISFDNVDVREVDFRNTNIRTINFNPQTVYHKDLSGCFFEILPDSITGALFDYSTDFTEVNLESTIIKQETLTLYNNSIAYAKINQHTVLPDELWKIRNEALCQRKTNIKKL